MPTLIQLTAHGLEWEISKSGPSIPALPGMMSQEPWWPCTLRCITDLSKPERSLFARDSDLRAFTSESLARLLDTYEKHD